MRVYNSVLVEDTLNREFEFNPKWYWNPNCFTDEEVVKIKELKDNYSFKRATTSGRDEKTTDSDTRESEVFWVEDNSDSRWIYNRIMECVVEANKNWGFSLTCSENIQYTKYSEPNLLKMEDKFKIRSHRDTRQTAGHYDWHADFGISNTHRKVSVVVQLSDENDYNGGRLKTWGIDGEITHSKKTGCCVIFPSFTLHKVEPVTKGIRESLVCWVQGPSFK